MKRLAFIAVLLALVLVGDALALFGRRFRSRHDCSVSYNYPTYYPTYYPPVYVAPPVAVLPAIAIPAYSADWKVEVARYYAAKADHAAYLQAIGAGGLAYGGNSLQYGNFGFQGSTLYGYSVNQVANDYYGSLDLNTLFQQAARHTDNAAALHQQGMTGFSELVGQASAGASRVAEIQAIGKVIRENLNPPKKTTFQGKIDYGTAPPVVSPPPVATGSFVEAFMPVVRADCAACHGGPKGEKNKTNFNVEDLPKFNAEQKAIVLNRIFTHDDKSRMPRNPDGSAGQLPVQRLAVYGRFLGQ